MSSKLNNVSKVEVVPIRQAFPKEAHHFTKWLEENIDALGERIGMSLTVIQREKQVGDFNVDLICEDQNEHPVIVENQLEKTDHDHLGKLLTYLVNLDASAAIWVTAVPRPEHQRVIGWLNENTPANISFYLVKVEGIKIGDSALAPFFSVLVGPDAQQKQIGVKKKEWAERHQMRFDFWTSLLEKCNARTKIFSGRSPSKDNWINAGAGKTGFSWVFVIWMEGGSAELYIDSDKEDGRVNKAIFDELYSQRAQIEAEMGELLDWERLDDKRACRIAKRFDKGGLLDQSSWSELQDQMVEKMIKLEKVFKPRLDRIKV